MLGAKVIAKQQLRRSYPQPGDSEHHEGHSDKTSQEDFRPTMVELFHIAVTDKLARVLGQRGQLKHCSLHS